MKIMKNVLHTLLGLAIALAAGMVQADGFPAIYFTKVGGTAFNAAGQLAVNALPYKARLAAGQPELWISGDKGLTLRLQLDSAGHLAGGVDGPDFVLKGAINGTAYSGDLLTGEVHSFVYHPDPSDTDAADIGITLNGGALLSHPGFGAGSVTIHLHMLSMRDASGNVFADVDFVQPWTAGAGGNVAP